jgi:phosphoglycerol transferase MdoB-like AlkP superfamily enzyme
MIRLLRLGIRIGILHMLFSQICRLVFIFCNTDQLQPKNIFLSLCYGLRFDIGVSLVICTIILLSWVLFKNYKLSKSIFIVILGFQSIVWLIDVLLYKYWDSIFSIRALAYFRDPIGIFKNQYLSDVIVAIIFIYIVTLLFRGLTDKFFLPNPSPNYTKTQAYGLILFLAGISFLALRGGFRVIPLNLSDGYFCDNKVYNLATVNSTWNFAHVLFEDNKFATNNPYHKLSDLEASTRIDELFGQNPIELYPSILQKSSNPNIILITMEGVSSELIGDFYKTKMPFLTKLKYEAFSFEKAFAVGFRTEQGIAALLSGTLATPFNNITDNVNILSEMPSILHSFEKRGYSTNFIFGGDLEFGNMRAYLSSTGMQKMITIDDFSESQKTQRLGVPDEFLFERAINQIATAKNPFFVQIMTQSTHQPFDFPGNKMHQSEDKNYEESASYLDRCISKFVGQLKKLPSWKNTILIITSDHSHKYPASIDIAEPQRFHIPMLIVSPLLLPNHVGNQDQNYFLQSNFPATLSYMLGFQERNFTKYSLNHFSNSPKFTYSAFVNGYIFQRDSTYVQYDYIWRPFDTTNLNLRLIHSYPMAILQTIVEEIRNPIVKKESRK